MIDVEKIFANHRFYKGLVFRIFKELLPGMVAHTCNPSYLGGRD
jgi:hypothetical protein